jgi:prophage regulatory protein
MSSMILRLPSVKTKTGLSRSTIYQRIAEGRFPKPISLGARAVGWVEAEVEAWLMGQIEQSRKLPSQRSFAQEQR